MPLTSRSIILWRNKQNYPLGVTFLSVPLLTRCPHGVLSRAWPSVKGGRPSGHRFPPCFRCYGCASFADACIIWQCARIVGWPVQFTNLYCSILISYHSGPHIIGSMYALGTLFLVIRGWFAENLHVTLRFQYLVDQYVMVFRFSFL